MMRSLQQPSPKSTFQKLEQVARLGFHLRDLGVINADEITAEALDYSTRHTLGIPEALVREIAAYVVEDDALVAA